MSGIPPSYDAFPGLGNFSSLLFGEQLLLDSSPDWQYPTPMTIRPAGLPFFN